jgi:methionine-rich copper-binding protein CopC
VQLRFEDPLPVDVEANLMDISESGFRVSHHCASLSPGLLVEFRHKLKAGRARVVWTQLRDGHHFSGFVIL